MESAKPIDSNPYEQMLPPAIDNSYVNPMNEDVPPQQMANNQYDQGFASDVNKLKQEESSCHCQSFVASILLVGGIVTGLVLFFFTDAGLSVGAVVGICVGSYAVYLLVACCFNTLGSYLGNIDRGQNFQNYYEWIRNGVGNFWFHAECYHYEIRHHTRTVRDSNGNTRHEHYTTREKVVTHTATENLTPRKTVDESGPIDRIHSEKNMVFIHFIILHRFSDSTSQYNFDSFYSGFKMRHTRDAHQDFTYGYQLPGLVDRKAFFVGQLGCNLNCWYYVCGLIGLLWPYSLWVQSKICRFRVQSMKVLTI